MSFKGVCSSDVTDADAHHRRITTSRGGGSVCRLHRAKADEPADVFRLFFFVLSGDVPSPVGQLNQEEGLHPCACPTDRLPCAVTTIGRLRCRVGGAGTG